MLSVVLYGRNDSHGYNLQKRAALSLNCIAAVLSDPDDEILFVDYNTPVDLPTFPESIADTLTERCRRMLRILRLRPAVHERLRGRTHLVCLESISRNVAIRRANPANRWILSTNTDMVFATREAGRSLSDVLADLDEGYHGLPRFDVPQALWESVDRADPAGVIERFCDWGRRFHLNEVIHGNPFILFDAPGDFQLMTRSDIEAIHGFHEGMILGWHVDSNLCKRMHLLRGGLKSLGDRLLGYHCDHSRQATLASRSNKIENDPVRFFNAVDSPFLPEQAQSWGLAGEQVEEIRLTAHRATRCADALAAVLPPMETDDYEGRYIEATYNTLNYPIGHVLPFILDHLATWPLESRIAYFGSSRKAFALFRRTWAALGFTGDILMSERMARSLMGTDDAATDGALPRVASLAEVERDATAFLFEFGTDDPADPAAGADPGPDPADPEAQERMRQENRRRLLEADPAVRKRLALTRAALLHTVERERAALAAGRGGPRKFYAVNAVNNIYEELFAEHVGITWAPYTSRLRHGYVKPEVVWPWLYDERLPLQRFLTEKLGRTQPVDPWEMEMIRADLAHILAAGDDEAVESRRFSEPLQALLDWPELVVESGAAARIESLRAALPVRRQAAGLRPAIALPATVRPAIPALNKLCAAEDWENPAWYAHARDCTSDAILAHSASTSNYFKRSRGVWERAQILYGMAALGVLDPQARGLLVSVAPDGLAQYLANRLAHLDVLDVAPIRRATDPWLARARLFDPDGVTVHLDGLETPALGTGRWDVVVIPQNTLPALGVTEAGRLLAWIDGHLSDDGVVAITMETVLNARSPAPGPRASQVMPWVTPAMAEAFEATLHAATGWRLASPFDWSLSDATLDRTVRRDAANRPHLVIQDGDILRTASVRLCRRVGATAPSAWRGLGDVLAGVDGRAADGAQA